MLFDGQSHNLYPLNGVSCPSQAMATRALPWVNIARTGQAWSTLAGTITSRVAENYRCHARAVAVLIGGSSDVDEGDSAAAVLADMESYAATHRALGASAIVAATIPPGALFADGGQDAVRLAANELIRASSSWDAVADVAGIPDLADYNDSEFYGDTVHWTTAGAALAAELVGDAIDTVVASL